MRRSASTANVNAWPPEVTSVTTSDLTMNARRPENGGFHCGCDVPPQPAAIARNETNPNTTTDRPCIAAIL